MTNIESLIKEKVLEALTPILPEIWDCRVYLSEKDCKISIKFFKEKEEDDDV